MTPEQMRALADALIGPMPMAQLDRTYAALRAAADQLERVEATVAGVVDALTEAPDECTPESVITALSRVLTADTAPQGDRMSKCDRPGCPELHPQCKDAILLAERARREGWHDIDGDETHR